MAYLEMREITKTFPGVVALNKINFSAEKGEVHAIAGEMFRVLEMQILKKYIMILNHIIKGVIK